MPLERKVGCSKNNVRFVTCLLSFGDVADNTVGDYVTVSTFKELMFGEGPIGKHNTLQWHGGKPLPEKDATAPNV